LADLHQALEMRRALKMLKAIQRKRQEIEARKAKEIA
jgi:hypothetical protein